MGIYRYDQICFIGVIMKVLLLNGSCKASGSTYTALEIVANELKLGGVDTEIFQIGTKPVRDCIGCGQCVGKYRCIFDDDAVNEFIEKAKEADGFVFGSPVYYAHADGRILCFLDRAFYAGKKWFEHKPAATVVVARRAGTTAALDTLNKYPTIAQMPLVSSSYWNMAFGSKPEDILKDGEGVQTMRNLAKNMTWLLSCIKVAGDNGVALPETEVIARTNFIRDEL